VQVDRRSEPATEDPLVYIHSYINDYGRPWTSSDVNLRIRPVHGQIAGTCEVLLVTTEQMASSSLSGRSVIDPAVTTDVLGAEIGFSCADG
jgi:hypothetical protein